MGVLVSVPIMEILRQQFALSYGRCVVDWSAPEYTSQWNVIAFALVCITILILVTDLADAVNALNASPLK
jgi:hypothetical protein